MLNSLRATDIQLYSQEIFLQLHLIYLDSIKYCLVKKPEKSLQYTTPI